MAITRAPTKYSPNRSYRSRDLTKRKNALGSKQGSCRYATNARLEARILEEGLLRPPALLLHGIIR